MAQFRTTQKFAADYKISGLLGPLQTLSLLDDWFIDVMKIHRKKIAIITHAKTLFTFIIPYAQVGGARSMPECVHRLLQQFLFDRSFFEYIDSIDQLFAKQPLFCKTQDRQVLGHMNEFKRCIEARTHDVPYDAIDWNDLMRFTNNILINVRPIGYTRASELMDQLLNKKTIN